jgi:ureidoacrylate peracid hydrolase
MLLKAPDLDLILRTHHIHTIILTGFATNVCVETTGRHAFAKDYDVLIVRDLVASDSKELHESSLNNFEMYFDQVVSSGEILEALSMPKANFR